MAEKQKESSSSSKSKEKSALLDLDIGKDFLASWKSMAGDDQIDFDFSTVAKGNKKPFNFDNMDMDFKLDDDFGRISSFKVDISDLDVSSPVKKAGKPSGKSKEVSEGKKTPGKSERSTFQFDFDGFDDFSFGPSLGKIAKQTNANQDAELSPSLSGSLGFGTHLKDTIGASEGETTSKFDSRLGGELNCLSKEKSHTSLTDVHSPSKSEICKDQATNLGTTISPQKPISGSTNQTDHDNCQKERITLLEQYKGTCQNSADQYVSEDSSTHQTACNSKEEVGCLARKESTNTDAEQRISDERTDFGLNCGNSPLDKLPVDMACSQSNESSLFSGDNPVQIVNNNDAEAAQSDTQFEQISTSASKKILHEIEIDGEIMDVTSELVVTQSNSKTAADMDLPGLKQATNVIRSKYFKGSDEAMLQPQQSSVSQIEAAVFVNKRIETLQLSSADKGARTVDKEMPNKESLPNIMSGSFKGLDEAKSQLQEASLSQVKVGTISSQEIISTQPSTANEKTSALPREQTSGDSVEIRSERIRGNLISNRGSLKSYDTRKILTNRSRLHDINVAKGGHVSNGRESEDLNNFRKLDNKVAKTGTESVVFPKAISREQTEGGSVKIKSQGIPTNLTDNGGGYISRNNGNTLTGTSRLHDKDAAKRKPVSPGSGNNIKNHNTFSLHVGPSSSNEQTNKSASLLGLNPRFPVSNMRSHCNNIISSENQKLPELEDGVRPSVLSNPNNLRTSEIVQPPSNSMLQKDTRLLSNSREGVGLTENKGSRMVHPADTRKQASSSPTLKRKKIEESSANLLMLKPTKRLFESPSGSRDSRESLEKFVDKENIFDGNTMNDFNDSQSSCLHIPQQLDVKEMETPLEMENDTNVVNAQACAKELDDLANMLKKKHEEAKEILVRAVVNNNKLLMLNHPMHEQKFRLVEEFAALLLSK